MHRSKARHIIAQSIKLTRRLPLYHIIVGLHLLLLPVLAGRLDRGRGNHMASIVGLRRLDHAFLVLIIFPGPVGFSRGSSPEGLLGGTRAVSLSKRSIGEKKPSASIVPVVEGIAWLERLLGMI